MANEKLKSKLIVTVTETEEDVHTQVAGLINRDTDTKDRADIALHVIKALDITVTDVVIWWLSSGPEEEHDASVQD